VHESYLVKVKAEDQVEEDYDFTELVEKIPADEAFRKASDSGCQMS
jgi:branched-chain amino acid transport system substrate-binding protein